MFRKKKTTDEAKIGKANSEAGSIVIELVKESNASKTKQLELSNWKTTFKKSYLTSMPPFLDWNQLTHLQVLKIEKHKLTDLPMEMEKIAGNLLLLSLSENQFTSIPKVVLTMKGLQQFEFNNNPLPPDNLPKELSQLTKLRKLSLVGCNINGIPVEIKKLKRLTHLNLSNNKLIVWQPELNDLLKLTHLNLESNTIAEISPFITSLSALEELNLKNNHLATLPQEIGLLPELKKLEIAKNKFKTTSRLHELENYNKELLKYLQDQAKSGPSVS